MTTMPTTSTATASDSSHPKKTDCLLHFASTPPLQLMSLHNAWLEAGPVGAGLEAGNRAPRQKLMSPTLWHCAVPGWKPDGLEVGTVTAATATAVFCSVRGPPSPSPRSAATVPPAPMRRRRGGRRAGRVAPWGDAPSNPQCMGVPLQPPDVWLQAPQDMERPRVPYSVERQQTPIQNVWHRASAGAAVSLQVPDGDIIPIQAPLTYSAVYPAVLVLSSSNAMDQLQMEPEITLNVKHEFKPHQCTLAPCPGCKPYWRVSAGVWLAASRTPRCLSCWCAAKKKWRW